MKLPMAVRRCITAVTGVAFILAGFPLQAAPVAPPVAAPGVAAAPPAPSALDAIRGARLAEPLIQTKLTTPAEDEALAAAIARYEQRTAPDDLTSLAAFAGAYPQSGWTAGVLTNLGLSYRHDGRFSRAIEAWRGAWRLGKPATEPRAKAMVDRAFGELIRLQAAFGRFDEVAALFKEMGKRPITGSATELVQEARELLVLTKKDPRHLYNCGPVGLKLLILAQNPKEKRGDFLQWYRVGPNGASLADLDALATQAQFEHRLIFRSPGQPVPAQGLIHWKLGHYAALVGKANGRYHLRDPAFPGADLWVTQAALDEESSGYFLVPADAPSDAGWRTVSAQEAGKIWGKGPTGGSEPGIGGSLDGIAGGGDCHGMCVYGLRLSTVGVTIFDTPVGYTPAFGPNVSVSLSYNQREDSQPANSNFSNVSPKWGLDWVTYINDDPTNPGANVSRYLVGGGAFYYSGYASGTGKFTPALDGSVLVRATSGAISYQRQLSDGSVEVYAQSDGATSFPRRIFLSQIIDPQGNAVALTYDSQLRLVSLTDATGRQTKFGYGFAASPWLITQITDPFGRSAMLAYDTLGRLSSITDVVGLTSSFTYDANSLVNALTTPYGTTSFSYTAPGSAGPPRFVNVTDPMGYHERLEWLEPAPISDSDPSGSVPAGMPNGVSNQYLSYRDSFYWDKDAYALGGCSPSGGCDYSKAVDYHFLHAPNATLKSPTLESVKAPLENRVWYNYPGQTASIQEGTINSPNAVGRVLDDGSTQLYQYTYDTSGLSNLTQATDPLGRVTNFAYASNGIDLTDVTQLTAGSVQASLAHLVYNTHHRPTSVADAAGQTTSLGYNSAQQLTSVTNALSETTSFNYNGTGDLTSVVNANTQTAATYTYDSSARLATYTDSEGWTASYSYDAADRLVRTTYPDGTFDAYTYDKLDLATYQDRLGRTWAYAYDANRRLTAVTEPTGVQTLFAYNGVGQLTSWTDANSHVTQWAYDAAGRPITKTFPDSSTEAFAYETTTSRLKSVTDTLSQVKQFSYAKDDRLLGVTYTGAVNSTPNISFAYDTYFPRLTSRTDGTGTTQFAYVAVGSNGALQLQTETTPLTSGTITFAYDQLGRVTSRTVQGSSAESVTYDAIGRTTGDAGDLGSFSFSYLGQTGQITGRQLASSNLATSWSYLSNANDRRLSSVSTTGLTSGQYSTFQYLSDSTNQTTGVSQSSDASINYPAASFSQSASYNTLNQLTALSGQTLIYDAVGNLTSDGARTYSWDAENRLVGIAYPGVSGKATAFTYDGLGRRATVVSTPAGGGSSTTTSLLWCGLDLCQTRDGSNVVTRAYFAEGEYAPGSPAQSYYYAPDQLGSVRRVFSASQAPTYDYDPYGRALQGTATVTDFAYAGMVHNADSGLYLATFRAYDPVAGRWISRDPIGEVGDPSGNLYAYVGGNSIEGADPHGLLLGALAPLLTGAGAAEAGSGGLLTPFVAGALLGGAAWLAWQHFKPPHAGPKPAPGGPGKGGKKPPEAPPGGGFCPPGSGGKGPGGNGPGGKGPPNGDKPASTPVGNSRSPMDVPKGTNEPGSVGNTNYTGHAFDRMQGRGVPPSAVEDALANGVKGPGNTPGSTTYYSPENNLTVVKNPNGTVKTVRKGPP